MPLAIALFTVWAAIVAWCDCRHRRVPNRWVIAGLFAALICSAVGASPFGGAPGPAVYGAILGCAALLPFFLLGVMGAADVKVFAVLGAWCGVSALLGLWIVASLAAAVHAAALLIAARVRSGRPSASASASTCASAEPLLWRSGKPTFALGARRATPYAALLVGAAALHLLGSLLRGAVR
jgi:prepilin peptidase CpaA